MSREETDIQLNGQISPLCEIKNDFDIRNINSYIRDTMQEDIPITDSEFQVINELCDYFPEACDIINTAGKSFLTYLCGKPSP